MKKEQKVHNLKKKITKMQRKHSQKKRQRPKAIESED